MHILNLTQHAATEEQMVAGVFEPADKRTVRNLLTIDELPSRKEIEDVANLLATLAKASGCRAAMIGGAPFLMGPLEQALGRCGIQPLYAFSKRESAEEKQADGSVKKTQIFRHAGFVEGPSPSEPRPKEC